MELGDAIAWCKLNADMECELKLKSYKKYAAQLAAQIGGAVNHLIPACGFSTIVGVV